MGLTYGKLRFKAFAMVWMICCGFWDITLHVMFVGRRFGTPCPLHLLGRSYRKEDGTERCSERSVNKYNTPGSIPTTRINYGTSCAERKLKYGCFICTRNDTTNTHLTVLDINSWMIKGSTWTAVLILSTNMIQDKGCEGDGVKWWR